MYQKIILVHQETCQNLHIYLCIVNIDFEEAVLEYTGKLDFGRNMQGMSMYMYISFSRVKKK